jgi:hypothetical protein
MMNLDYLQKLKWDILREARLQSNKLRVESTRTSMSSCITCMRADFKIYFC